MSKIQGMPKVNDFVVKFANVNGSGSASANNMFAKCVFRMGIPVSPHNIFPSNIQGLPTWYEVRISDAGYLGRREGVDLMVAMNEQTIEKDIAEVVPGGYVLYDSSKPLADHLRKEELNYLPIPLKDICIREFDKPNQRQLFKNIVYVGALAAFLNIDFEVLTNLVSDQFRGKEKLILPNIHALELGHQYARENFDCPLNLQLKTSDQTANKILIDGNTAIGLGCVYGGATVASWYPLTPSTSVVDSFNKYCNRLRIDPGSGKKKFSIVQAEDELAAIGIAIGAGWNGARAFTATSGPGISLMQEFLGLAYFSEVPVVLFNIQRTGPSTGMPTRTQQGDLLSCAYASHGDTRHVLLFPANPEECFYMARDAFDLADRLQTPVIVMSDLDIGMNDWMCPDLKWDDDYVPDRGKVLSAEQLEEMDAFYRYLDVDGDGIPYRTFPGEHPKGSYFTRGSGHTKYGGYTEDSAAYQEVVDRLLVKWETARDIVPKPDIEYSKFNKAGVIAVGSSDGAVKEAIGRLAAENHGLNYCRVKAFPFTDEVRDFIDKHDQIYVVEQNRDAQLRSLIMLDLDIGPEKLVSILHYNGMPLSAGIVVEQILAEIAKGQAA